VAQDPLKPKDDGKIRLPTVVPGMNRIAPRTLHADENQKGAGLKALAKRRRRGGVSPDQFGGSPALSASINTLPQPAAKPPVDDVGEEDKPPREEPGADKTGKLSQDDIDSLLRRTRKRFERCVFIESENRKDALDDLKFLAGDQWPASVTAQRQADKRPQITINKLPTFVHQICNDLRQNRPGINVNPVGEKSDIEVAKMYRGLIRSIERDSRADIAYDTGVFGAVANGFGFVVLRTKYERPDDFDQSISIDRVRNAFTVYLDPDHQQPDGSDAMYGFITDMMPRDEFKEKYPDADQMPFNQAGIGDSPRNWNDKDNIRIAEYYEVVTEPRTLVALDNGHVGWKDDLAQAVLDAIARGELHVEREREAEQRKVKFYKITQTDVLEHSDTVWAWVPIIKFIGDEIDIEGKVKLSGIVRAAKDPQRMVNYWNTLYTELVALAPKAPFIGAEGQFEGSEDTWKRANIDSFSYLQYKLIDVNGKPIPPPQRQPMVGVPTGIQQAIQNAEQSMMATTGVRFDATQNERMIDESGKAIRELRRSGDLGSFHFADNMARSLRHIGEIIVDAIPKVYDNKRMLTILREDDSEEQVQIDPNAPRPMSEVREPPSAAHQNGRVLKIFNPAYGKYGVTVTIGPAYATKRIEAAESMMSFLKSIPPDKAGAIVDLVVKQMDWPGADDIARRLSKMIPPNLLAPDIKDVPPQVQALIQGLQQQLQQMRQQMQVMGHALQDKTADRALAKEKIDKDFEAKLLGIMQKADASSTDPVEKFATFAKGLHTMMMALEPPHEPKPEGRPN
jgi:hypothetical protein